MIVNEQIGTRRRIDCIDNLRTARAHAVVESGTLLKAKPEAGLIANQQYPIGAANKAPRCSNDQNEWICKANRSLNE